jgi:hypothetical protein
VTDTIHVNGTANQVWYGFVREVDYSNRKATVQWYRETQRQGVWSRTNEEDEVHFASIVKVCNVDRVFGGYRIV